MSNKILIIFLLFLLFPIASANLNDCELIQINSTHWYFETTQTDLADGEYNYQAFANNISSDYSILEIDLTRLYYDVYNLVGTDGNVVYSETPTNITVLKAASTTGTVNISVNTAGAGEEYNFTVNSGVIDWLNVTSGLINGQRYEIKNTSVIATETASGGSVNFTDDILPGTYTITLDNTSPASITGLTNTTGNFWHNWTWTNPVDIDFNYTQIYINGVWTTNTSNKSYNFSASAHNSSTISTHTVDTTGNINTTWINHTSIIPNNPITITDVTVSYSVIKEGILNIDANYTDADGDAGTFSDNSSEWDVNSTTGIVYWATVIGDEGTYYWYINVSDGYGSVSTQAFIVSVNSTNFTFTEYNIATTNFEVTDTIPFTVDIYNTTFNKTSDSTNLILTKDGSVYNTYILTNLAGTNTWYKSMTIDAAGTYYVSFDATDTNGTSTSNSNLEYVIVTRPQPSGGGGGISYIEDVEIYGIDTNLEILGMNYTTISGLPADDTEDPLEDKIEEFADYIPIMVIFFLFIFGLVMLMVLG